MQNTIILIDWERKNWNREGERGGEKEGVGREGEKQKENERDRK